MGLEELQPTLYWFHFVPILFRKMKWIQQKEDGDVCDTKGARERSRKCSRLSWSQKNIKTPFSFLARLLYMHWDNSYSSPQCSRTQWKLVCGAVAHANLMKLTGLLTNNMCCTTHHLSICAYCMPSYAQTHYLHYNLHLKDFYESLGKSTSHAAVAWPSRR